MCIGNDPPRDCYACILWRRAGSSIKGRRIPDGRGGWASGKCTWSKGPEVCQPTRTKGQLGG